MSKKIFTLDPGKTSGFAFFENGELLEAGWFKSELEQIKFILQNRISHFKPDEIVIETFRLYPWKAKNQFWSDFLTTEVIGIFKYFAMEIGVPVIMQPASNKQPFPDDSVNQHINTDTHFHFKSSQSLK